MDKDQVRFELQSRLPSEATDMHFVGLRVYFTMYREWQPTTDSGAFRARTHRPILGRRWQIRL